MDIPILNIPGVKIIDQKTIWGAPNEPLQTGQRYGHAVMNYRTWLEYERIRMIKKDRLPYEVVESADGRVALCIVIRK